MITLKNIEKLYGTGTNTFKALDGIDLEIKKGEFAVIVGASGSGKSTLLNIIGCMDSPTGGEYFFENENILNKKYKQLAAFRNKKIGFVFQSFNLAEDCTAAENVEMPLGYAGIKKAQRDKRVKEILNAVGLSDKAKSFPRQLSGGQQQRVAIARALANNPELILADEPTGNLDTNNSAQIMELFQKIHRKSNRTIIMITHNPELAEQTDRVIKIADGRIYEMPRLNFET